MIKRAISLLSGGFGYVILIAIAATLALLLLVSGVQTWRLHSAQTDLAKAHSAADKRERQLADQLATWQTRARAAESSNAQATADLDAGYQRGVTDGQKRTESTLAALRSGNLRLRHDLAASACTAGMSGTGTAAGSDQPEADAGLWRSSAEALVRIADEADDTVMQLNACIDKSAIDRHTAQQGSRE